MPSTKANLRNPLCPREIEDLSDRHPALDLARFVCLHSSTKSLDGVRGVNFRLLTGRWRDYQVDLKARIDQLESAEDSICPTCGEPLDAKEREKLIAELNIFQAAAAG